MPECADPRPKLLLYARTGGVDVFCAHLTPDPTGAAVRESQGGFSWTRYRGLDRTGLAGYLVATAYNLVRMAKLLGPMQEAPSIQAA